MPATPPSAVSGPPSGQLAFDLRSLGVFLEVVAGGSMTAAAERLGMTQPAVSQIVRRLEDELGTPLIERRVRPFRPTPAGDELAERARGLLAEAERIQASVRDIGGATLPLVRIGLIDSFAATAGPALIRAMRNYAQNLTVWSGITPTLMPDLIRRRLDFVVATDPMESLGGFERHRIMREPFLLVMPQPMARAMKEVRIEDLARNHPFVRYSVRSLIGAQIERYLQQHDIRVPRALEFDGTEAVFAMVSAGLGWAVTTPLCLVHGQAHAPQLTALPLPGPGFSRTLHLVGREEEFGTLAGRIAEQARGIARDLVDRKVSAMAPWAVDQIRVG